ncbi:uncharacterized protein LOC135715095, partial [Ochlerotatus camptorhynchus]|uniref:uncharacterized protein LOC135715095 n=1 Tax=Ochlerotatus camptorhynchus TaxID=644619 RepID=UPI0031DCEA10
ILVSVLIPATIVLERLLLSNFIDLYNLFSRKPNILPLIHVPVDRIEPLTKSLHSRYRINVRSQHCNTEIISSIAKQNIELPLLIPRIWHAAKDPDHVQVKVLELLPGTLLPVVSLPFVDVVDVDSVLSDALREDTIARPRILSSCSSSSIVRWPGFNAWYCADKRDMLVSAMFIQQHRKIVE